MKKYILILFLLFSISIFSQPKPKAFDTGEWLKYRMSYSNFLNAGFATLEIKDALKNNKPAYHIDGHGKTTGLIGLFFKVKDNYQSYIYKDNLKPILFKRRVDEGGHIINRDVHFDHNAKTAFVKDLKKNHEKTVSIGDVQDMLSALYNLRSVDFTNFKKGDEIKMSLFFDYETYDFRLKYLGVEIVKTKFGKVESLKFKPLVQAGRVFKEKESVTIWVSNDANKIPIKVKASLAVGSLRADLDGYKGLTNPFNIIFDN